MQQLTPEQFARFRAVHRRFLTGFTVAIAYCVGIVIVDRFMPLESYGFLLTVGFFVVTVLVVWAMFGYRCPACGQVPRAQMLAFGSAEITYSSMLALFPKTCSSCGVRLKPPKGD
jgi:predicted RNA-binding Zn-ribbon protein involved in translation (DUF1610 family)